MGTAHLWKTKPVVLWVYNASFIVGVSGNHDNSDTRVDSRKIGATFLVFTAETYSNMAASEILIRNGVISGRVMSDVAEVT